MTNAALVITPFEGVGEIRFGIGRSSVRKLCGRPDEIVRKPSWSSQATDVYMSAGFSLGYDHEGRLAEIELFDPARAAVRGVELLGRPAGQVFEELRSVGGDEMNPAGYDYPGIGLSFALRGANGLGEPVQSVTASMVVAPREPDFFSSQAQVLDSPEVGRDHVGRVSMPGDRQSMRNVLGEGMATVRFGRDFDVFFQGIVVEYDADGLSTGVVVNKPGPIVEFLPVSLGFSYAECLQVLDGHGLAYEEGEAEIRVPDLGISLFVARDGNPALPIAAIAIDTNAD